MRRFHLQRSTDPSGVSGLGCVAEGVKFTDGRIAMRWLGTRSSIAIHKSLEDMIGVHGHEGATTLVWADEASDAEFTSAVIELQKEST